MNLLAKKILTYLQTLGRSDSEIKYRFITENLRQLSKSNKTIIIGPWISEIGFEILYWIPFLRWFINTYQIDINRIAVVSRGGVKSWYNGIAKKYFEIFDLFSVEEFKRKNDQRIARQAKKEKQIAISEFDLEILSKIESITNLKDYQLLHPLNMYGLFRVYWNNNESVSFIKKHSIYKLMRKLDKNDDLNDLPKNYIALKFYFSSCFPENNENISFIKDLIHCLSLKSDLVLLNTGLNADNHIEPDIHSHKIINTKDKIASANNLETQTRILSHASAFFGTYGGFAYLAPLLGLPTYCFYSDENKFLPIHLDVARRAYRTINHEKLISPTTTSINTNTESLGDFNAMHINSFKFLNRLLI